MKVLFLIGNAAVGKMTVGRELMEITDLLQVKSITRKRG